MIKYKKLSEMKKWEEAAYPTVKRIVDKHDPETLLRLGCPKDEYDSISRRVANALTREKFGPVPYLSTRWVANILALSFHISFGAWGEEVSYPKFYRKVAKELVEELVKKNLLSGKLK